MLSQAKMVKGENTEGSEFDGYYVDTEQKEPGQAISMSSKTSIEGAEPRYIELQTQATYHSEGKERQVGWWLGRVERVYEDYFTAVMEDLKEMISIAEFDKNEITPSDLNLLVPNARFSYTVTQVDKRSGREYVSKISLSGPAIWTDRDSERAKESYKKTFPEELFDF